MTRWAAFAGITLAVLVLLLALARASQSLVTEEPPGRRPGRRWLDALPDGADHLDAAAAPAPGPAGNAAEPIGGAPPDVPPTGPSSGGASPAEEFSTVALLGNVAVSHGVFAVILLGGAWLTGVPAAALGVTDEPLSTGPLAVGVGLALGAGLAVANTAAAALAARLGADPSEELRSLLAPETRRGWVVLLVVVLPVIAGFEELLFRGALIGAVAVGFEISPWVLAVLSSVAFAAGHGAQGGVGVVVTGLLGFALAAAFVLTGSLLVVIVAHYVVNAAEFVVAEGIGWEPFR